MVLTVDEFYEFKKLNHNILPEIEEIIKTPKTKQNQPIKSRNTPDFFASNIRNLLNKLSDSNLDKLSDEIKKLKFESRQSLITLTDQLFMKAMMEPKFSRMYARLAVILKEMTFENFSFKQSLVQKCQNMFTESISISKNVEDTIFKHKDNLLGCTTFIGELYNSDILSKKIMNNCFSLIFLQINNKKFIIDILCTLLLTIGQRFGKECKTDLNEIIKKLEQLKKGGSIQLKDKFLIMSVFDKCNQNRWTKS